VISRFTVWVLCCDDFFLFFHDRPDGSLPSNFKAYVDLYGSGSFLNIFYLKYIKLIFY
jgi:hypothetical protein